MQDFTGVPAVVDLAAMRDAMAAMGGDPAQINPLAPAELVIDHSVQVDAFGTRDAFRINAEREFERNRERYAFLRWGQQAFEQLRGRAARHRDRAPGQPRVPRARGVRRAPTGGGARAAGRTAAGLPRHARRHRLAHDDGQRPRRARLGRRRDRGRGGDARPADVDADPAGARLPAARRAARGRDRDRPRADRHRDAARARRRGDVRRVLRRRPRRPADRRPRDDRQHVARVRLDLRDLPDRRRDAALPARCTGRPPSRSSSSRPTPASRACGTTSAAESPTFSETIELDLGAVEPSLAGPKRPQDRVPLATRARVLPRGARAATSRTTTPATRPRPRAFPPATRPPTATTGRWPTTAVPATRARRPCRLEARGQARPAGRRPRR